MTPPNENWFEALMFTGLASFAGLMGYLMRNSNDRRVITWERSLLETMASGFIGFLTVLLCRALNIPYEWTGFIAGVLGWLGATASIQLFERIVRKKLGIENVDLGDPKTNGEQSASQHSADSTISESAGTDNVPRGDTPRND